MRAEVDSLDPDRLLNTAPADLAGYLVEKYGLEAPRRLRDQWSTDETEMRVDVRYDQRRHVSDRNRPCLVPGQRIEVEVPIHGEADLMYARASTFNFSPPRAEIRGGSLRIVIEIPHDAADRTRTAVGSPQAQRRWPTTTQAGRSSRAAPTRRSQESSKRLWRSWTCAFSTISSFQESERRAWPSWGTYDREMRRDPLPVAVPFPRQFRGIGRSVRTDRVVFINLRYALEGDHPMRSRIERWLLQFESR